MKKESKIKLWIFIIFIIIISLRGMWGNFSGIVVVLIIAGFIFAVNLKNKENFSFLNKYFPNQTTYKDISNKKPDFSGRYEKDIRADINKSFRLRKIWWKDFSSPGNNYENFHGLIMDEKGLEYKGQKFPWGRIKNMYFPFKKSQKLAESFMQNPNQDFIPTGNRLFIIRTGNARKWIKNYVRIADVREFVRVLRKKSMLHKLRLSK